MEDKNTGTITSMGNCYECAGTGVYGIVLAPIEVYSCDAHYDELYKRFIKNKKQFVCDLHQAETWTHRSKKTDSLVKHKLSKGKAWEIEHRTLAEDGKTVINERTGKPAEY